MNLSIKIETLTPIFIGDGESYFPLDCIVKPESRELGIINRKKFLDKIYKTPVLHKQFSDLTLSNQTKQTLQFIQQNGKDCIEYSIPLSMPALDYITKQENLFRAPIDTCTKESLSKKPIIPGSTVKGMLKTVVAHSILKKNPNRKKDMDSLLKNKINSDQFFKELFGDFENDLFRLISVGDFVLEKGQTKIIQPINKGTKRNATPMPLLLESIDAGSIFQGSIYIDDTFIKSNLSKRILTLEYFQPTKESLLESLRLYSQNIMEEEKKRFKVDMSSIELSKHESICKLGKHAGAGSKSIPDYRDIQIRAGARYIRNDTYQGSFWMDSDKQPLGWTVITFL